jgi:hypothetical protein
MITVKELAERNHVSCEAIRKQLRRYKKELDGHVLQQGRTQLLDDEAIAFLQEHRSRNPIIIQQEDKSAWIEQLQEQNTLLLAKVAEQAEKIVAQSKEILQLERFRLESSEKLRLSEELSHKSERKVQELTTQSERAAAELKQLRAELEAERHRRLTWKERLFGRK